MPLLRLGVGRWPWLMPDRLPDLVRGTVAVVVFVVEESGRCTCVGLIFVDLTVSDR